MHVVAVEALKQSRMICSSVFRLRPVLGYMYSLSVWVGNASAFPGLEFHCGSGFMTLFSTTMALFYFIYVFIFARVPVAW